MTDKDTAGAIAAEREPLPAPAPSKIETIVEAMFVERINNSIVSRNTEIYNYVRQWVDDLKRRLAKES